MMELFGKYPELHPQLLTVPVPRGESAGRSSLQDFMTAEEVSDVVAWLAGDGSATISGSQINVDRGTMKY